MGNQFNIRNETARELAVSLSVRLGKPLHKVVEEALRAFDAAHPHPQSAVEKWLPQLRAIQADLRGKKIEFEIEDLYDPETGLPV